MAQIPLDIEEAAEKLIITLRTKVVFGCSPIEYREIKLLFAFALSQEREAVARELREAMLSQAYHSDGECRYCYKNGNTDMNGVELCEGKSMVASFDSKLAELGISLK